MFFVVCLCFSHGSEINSVVFEVVCEVERPSELSWRARHGRKKIKVVASRTPPGTSSTSTPRTLKGPPVPAPQSKGKGKGKGKLSYRDATLQPKRQKDRQRVKTRAKTQLVKVPSANSTTFPIRRALSGHKGPPLLSLLLPLPLSTPYGCFQVCPPIKARHSWLSLPPPATTFTLSTSVTLFPLFIPPLPDPGLPGHKGPPLLEILAPPSLQHFHSSILFALSLYQYPQGYVLPDVDFLMPHISLNQVTPGLSGHNG